MSCYLQCIPEVIKWSNEFHIVVNKSYWYLLVVTVLASTDIPDNISTIIGPSRRLLNEERRRKEKAEKISNQSSAIPCSTNLHIAYACSPFFHFSFPLGWRSVDSAQGCKHSINRERKWKRERELTCKREARQLRVPQR